MVRGWFTVRVDLLSGAHVTGDPRAGRIMLVGPRHTLKDLAEAIDLAFARWDLAHLHEFEFLCRVEHSSVDPERLAGIVPEKPIPVWGWGWIPDQYGRRWDGDDGSEDGPCPVCGNSWSDD